MDAHQEVDINNLVDDACMYLFKNYDPKKKPDTTGKLEELNPKFIEVLRLIDPRASEHRNFDTDLLQERIKNEGK